MSPIAPGSKLGRVIAIKTELTELLKKISAIINLSNIDTIKLKVKLVLANITRIKTSWTTYLNLVGEEDRQPINEDLNISIANILISGQTIKNIRINGETLSSLINNLDTLSQQTTTAISQTANLESILDIVDRIALASNRSSRPVPPPSPHLSPLSPLPLPLPLPLPPPFSAPPGLRRQPNIGTQQTSLVRQQAIHSLLDLDGLDGLDDLRIGQGKKYFKQRRLTHRNKLRGRKSKKHYKTRRA